MSVCGGGGGAGGGGDDADDGGGDSGGDSVTWFVCLFYVCVCSCVWEFVRVFVYLIFTVHRF